MERPPTAGADKRPVLVEHRRRVADGAWYAWRDPCQRRGCHIGKRFANRPDDPGRYPGGCQSDEPLSGGSLGDAFSDCVNDTRAIGEAPGVGCETRVGGKIAEPERESAASPLRIAPNRDDERSI